MDADLRILFTVPLVVLFVVALVLLLVVEGVFARGALNIIIIEEEVVVGEDEDIPLLLLFSSRSEERVRACSSEDICFIFSLSLCVFCLWRFVFLHFRFSSTFRFLHFFGFGFLHFFLGNVHFFNSNHMRV